VTAPVLPEYGTGSLAELLPSVAAHLGVDGFSDRLGLAEHLTDASKVVVLLVDGLGWCALGDHRDQAPFLASQLAGGRSITTGFPSTTASSLGTFGTGLPPGAHGLVGYTFALPGEPGIVNALRWDTRVDPVQAQPLPTVLERAAAAGVRVTHVAERAFLGSGLTRAALRGADYPGADTPGETVQIVRQAVEAPGRGLVYAYTGELDNVGHLRGCGSQGWLAQLAHVDLLVTQLAAVLPRDAVLLVTADHGMVDVPEESKIDYDSLRELTDGVHMLGGEPRARHVYARAGAATDVLDTWRGLLGDRAWVLGRDAAVAQGWFGDVDPRVAPRIGDVVAAARDAHAVVRTRAFPREASLVGHHGSLTADEVLVPLLTARGAA
jgi:hypothetical protein